MDGVTAIAQILRREGVDFIGCVPYQPLLEAAAIAGIRPIIFRIERKRAEEYIAPSAVPQQPLNPHQILRHQWTNPTATRVKKADQHDACHTAFKPWTFYTRGR